MPTNEGRGRRLGRPAAGHPHLTVDRILATALAFVDEHGLGALSMRRLATELGVDPMAIYHHLPNKAAVVSGLVERVFAQMRLPAPEDGGGWAAMVRVWVHAYHELTHSHPNLVLQIVSDPAAVSRAGELINAPLRRALAQAGLEPDQAEACAGMFVDFVNGYALGESGHAQPGTAHPVSTTGFDVGLDVMLLGVQAMAAETTTR